MTVDPSAMAGLSELQGALPSLVILTDESSLATRSRDWWAWSRLLEATGADVVRPRAVLLPTTNDDVADILRWANRTKTPVVPRGLGSGVCGGALPDAGSVVLDLSAMDQVLHLDLDSHVVHTQAGIRGDRLEEALAAHGLTTGHYPQSIALSTPGGWVAAAGAGQASAGFGSIEDRLVGITVVLADGTIVRQRALPRAASGPQMRPLFVGSEGTLGVITEVELEVAEIPPSIHWRAYAMPSFTAAWDVARELKRRRFDPMILRGWDAFDARRTFAARLLHAGGAVGLVGFRGDAIGLADRLAAADAVYRRHGGQPLGDAYGEDWWTHRLDAVQVFEAVMGPGRSMGPGVVLDTFEVVSLWGDLGSAYESIMTALASNAVEVGCHFSHTYATGAGLYFTFFIKAPDDDQAARAYLQLWTAALRACHASGASIAHHHGVGRLKQEAFVDDIGPGTAHLLGLLKASLDPNGILNPALQLGPATTRQIGPTVTPQIGSSG